MVQYQLAVSIELAPLAIVIAGDHIHLFSFAIVRQNVIQYLIQCFQ